MTRIVPNCRRISRSIFGVAGGASAPRTPAGEAQQAIAVSAASTLIRRCMDIFNMASLLSISRIRGQRLLNLIGLPRTAFLGAVLSSA